MRPADTRLLLCAFGIAVTAGMPPMVGSPATAASPAQADKNGEQVFSTVCGRCHPVERVTAMRRTRSQWEEAISSMITARGAQITDEDFDTILSYLVKVYGRVDVNRAPAADLVEVLDISSSMASAIVAHRREHGRFEDFDALLKVPGIDREKLEAKRDAMTFS